MSEKTMLSKFFHPAEGVTCRPQAQERIHVDAEVASAAAQTSVKKPQKRRMFLKRDLAQSYFPSASGRSALQHLRRAIKGDPQLRGELSRAGYKVRTHYFTLRQARILDFYFG